MKRKILRRTYWLVGGTESCPICLHHHVLEMEVRCAACDRGICSQCAIVVRETRESFCPDCQPEEG